MISAIILAKNEEKNIGECIEALAFCEEIIVIDDYSSDKTVEIARGLGANIFQRKLEGNFASQRNFGLEKATNKWVLFIDADERVSKELRDEIEREVVSLNNPYLGYFFKRDDYIFGKRIKFGETSALFGFNPGAYINKFLRLARRSAGKWRRPVHEVWEVSGRTKSLKNTLKHYPHQTLREYISDINFHSDLHAEANYKEGKRSSLLKILLWPKLKFLNNYFFRLGLLDGTEGFVLALSTSFHSFLAWSKLWIYQRKN